MTGSQPRSSDLQYSVYAIAPMCRMKGIYCRLNGYSISPGKPTNGNPSFDTARAVRDQLVDLICKRIVRAED